MLVTNSLLSFLYYLQIAELASDNDDAFGRDVCDPSSTVPRYLRGAKLSLECGWLRPVLGILQLPPVHHGQHPQDGLSRHQVKDAQTRVKLHSFCKK